MIIENKSDELVHVSENVHNTRIEYYTAFDIVVL